MGDADRSSSAGERAGRAVVRALRALFGDRFVSKTKRSAEVLREEFEAGKRESEDQPDPPREIPHRDVEPSPPAREER